MELQEFEAGMRSEWNDFVRKAKNGNFLFDRGYLEYHADRFEDASLMFRKKGRLAAVLPASRHGNEVVSHGGLTFGGMICDTTMTTPSMMDCFESLIGYLREREVTTLVYKAVPAFYHQLPADEDLYALVRLGARLVRRDVGSVVRTSRVPKYQERRTRAVKKAIKAGVTVGVSDDWGTFWRVLSANLGERHETRPVHSEAEIRMLVDRFPSNIRLFAATVDGVMLAGTVVFENPTVAHTQYIATAPEGRRIGALDCLFADLIEREYRSKDYFSFGISTEDEGRVLNVGLIEQKEGFGARACVQDFYELDVTAIGA